MADDDFTAKPDRASARLAAALGRPTPTPLTPAEARDFEAAQDRADAEAEHVWGIRRQAAA